MNLRQAFCLHSRRDQGVVGYCARCGHFKRLDKTGYLWTRYVPAGLSPRRPPPPS